MATSAMMHLLRVQTGISRSEAVTRVTARRNKETSLQLRENRLAPSPFLSACFGRTPSNPLPSPTAPSLVAALAGKWGTYRSFLSCGIRPYPLH